MAAALIIATKTSSHLEGGLIKISPLVLFLPKFHL